MDLAFQLIRCSILCVMCIVSILVLMDLAFQQPKEWKHSSKSRVSILVLMDLAFQQSGKTPPPTAFYRFNPCFNGSCFSTYSIVTDDSSNWKFQSLF